MKHILLTFLLVCSFSSTRWYASEVLKVGTIERPPFAYKEGSEWKGFSIDLWKDIAQENGFSYEFVEYREFAKMMTATKEKQNDLSVANISITLERETFLDFSQPIFDSGLNVLAIKWIVDQELYFSPLLDNAGKILLSILLFLIGLTHFFWILNVVRGNIGFLSYFREIIPIFFEIVSQIKTAHGIKILLSASLFAAIFVTSYFSQKISYVFAAYDESYKESEISQYANIDPSEFQSLRIGVTEWSTSSNYLKQRNISPTTYRLFEEMPEALKKGNIDIVIHDDPVLRYFSENRGENKFIVAGKTFQAEKFAIAFPEKSPLIEKIDQTLLQIKESGKYKDIYEVYF
jgi:polar amino acid transport system substrate-binding protein